MKSSKRSLSRSGWSGWFRWVVTVVLLIFPTSLLWNSSPDTVYRMIRYNVSGVDDFKIFPGRTLYASENPYRFQAGDDSNIPQTVPFRMNKNMPLEKLLSINGTLAFLIVKDDQLLIERYFNGHSKSSLSLSFSIAKSILSILVGCAIQDGYILSEDQPITDFVPELASAGFGEVKIKHLLNMTSGMDYADSDNPYSSHARLYYTDNIVAELLNLKLEEPPGKQFSYKSGDAALLGLLLSRALAPHTITAYLQDRLWEPLGMEFDGQWSIDHEGNGIEKTWCCIAASARDFAKFGRLYLNKGNWNGNQIVPSSWVEHSITADESEGGVWYFQYLWWLVSKDAGDYNANGHLGQFLYVHPEKNIVIVRLGTESGSMTRWDWLALFQFLAAKIH